jgi:CheY-like chemotaxis protein
LNAKVAFKLFRKLGIVDITHAKDGIEGCHFGLQLKSQPWKLARKKSSTFVLWVSPADDYAYGLSRSPNAKYVRQISLCLVPGMDGLSATKILMTEYPENRRPTIIAMTAK